MTDASQPATVRDLLARGANSAPALLAPERPTLDFAGLRRHVDATVAGLNELGIGRGDRVAIVLPNGPEMAAAFLAVACGATTAPLNPAYRAEEFEFYLSDLQAKALIVTEAEEGPALAVAAGTGRRCCACASRRGARGPVRAAPRGRGRSPRRRRRLRRPGRRGARAAHLRHDLAAEDRAAAPRATSRPRPATSASTLALTPDDRCLNIMPLFHIHGLIAAMLASLAAGGVGLLHAGLQRAPLLRLAR